MSTLPKSQVLDLLVQPLAQMEENQRNFAILVAEMSGFECARDRRYALLNGQVPTITPADYVEEVVRTYCEEFQDDETIADWNTALENGSIENDPRVHVYCERFRSVIEALHEQIQEQREILAGTLDVPTCDVVPVDFGWDLRLVLFRHDEDLFFVFLDASDVDVAKSYIQENLHVLREEPEFLLTQTRLPEGADLVIDALSAMPDLVASESIEALVVDVEQCVTSAVATFDDNVSYMTWGIATDGAIYDLEDDVRIVRVLEIDPNALWK